MHPPSLFPCSHVFGEGVPKPVLTFEEASFPSYVLSEVVKAGFTHPTPIQSQGWPMALLGRDLIGLAETGSGGERVAGYFTEILGFFRSRRTTLLRGFPLNS